MKTEQAFLVSDLLQRVERNLRQRCLLARGQSLLVAISGGVDSMVLLDLLHSLAKRNRWQLSVAHFNHHLRGPASAADEKLVRETAAGLGLRFVGGGADVKKVAAQSKLSLEMAGRKLRHEFLACTARDHGIPTLALAHHADDQVELFFLRLLRGAGGEGLAGMRWRSPSPADRTVSLIRPLLDVSKEELLAYARAHRIRFRDDATNFTTDILRNRIRHELLPLLRKKYQPGLHQTVLRLMDIVGAEAEFVSAAANDFCGSRAEQTPDQPRFTNNDLRSAGPLRSRRRSENRKSNGGFAELPVAVQRKLLQQQLADFGLVPDFELIEQLRAAPDKAVSVGVGCFAVRDVSGNISCRETMGTEFNRVEHPFKLAGKEGWVAFAGRKFHWRVAAVRRFKVPPKQRTVGRQPIREFFDADKVGDGMVLRHWRPGDRFQPIGLTSAVKLQDLFVNAKIPAGRRRELVLATTNNGVIFWVEGLRISEEFKLIPATRRKLAWRATAPGTAAGARSPAHRPTLEVGIKPPGWRHSRGKKSRDVTANRRTKVKNRYAFVKSGHSQTHPAS